MSHHTGAETGPGPDQTRPFQNQMGDCVSYPDIQRQMVCQVQSHPLISLAWVDGGDKGHSLGLVGHDQSRGSNGFQGKLVAAG